MGQYTSSRLLLNANALNTSALRRIGGRSTIVYNAEDAVVDPPTLITSVEFVSKFPDGSLLVPRRAPHLIPHGPCCCFPRALNCISTGPRVGSVTMSSRFGGGVQVYNFSLARLNPRPVMVFSIYTGPSGCVEVPLGRIPPGFSDPLTFWSCGWVDSQAALAFLKRHPGRVVRLIRVGRTPPQLTWQILGCL